MICHHHSEWGVDYATHKPEVEALLNEGIKKEEDSSKKEKLQQKKEQILTNLDSKLQAFNFWKEVKVPVEPGIPEDWIFDPSRNITRKRLPWEINIHDRSNKKEQQLAYFPASPKVYHFHPVAFVEQMRKLSSCNCPIDEPLFKCSKTNYGIGPVYFGNIKLSDVKAWEEIDKVYDTVVTNKEKRIVSVMAQNEGKCDTIQAYDSEILTLGAMQKTVNQEGFGEFPTQVYEFKEKHPDKYRLLFERCGWIVEKENNKARMYYNCYKGKITGTELRALVREGFDINSVNQKLANEPLAHLIKVGKDEDFIRKQVFDFILRIRKYCNKKPNGYSYQIKKYFKSALGKALILDQSVNRPAYVTRDVGIALTTYFTEKDNETIEFNLTVKNPENKKNNISRNPDDWGNKHTEYENRIIEIYAATREMNDSEDRYNALKNNYERILDNYFFIVFYQNLFSQNVFIFDYKKTPSLPFNFENCSDSLIINHDTIYIKKNSTHKFMQLIIKDSIIRQISPRINLVDLDKYDPFEFKTATLKEFYDGFIVEYRYKFTYDIYFIYDFFKIISSNNEYFRCASFFFSGSRYQNSLQKYNKTLVSISKYRPQEDDYLSEIGVNLLYKSFNDYSEESKHYCENYNKQVLNAYKNNDISAMNILSDIIIIQTATSKFWHPITEDIVGYNNSAYYLEQKGYFKEAVFLLSKILEVSPNRTVAYINLGDAYWGQQEYAYARKAYQKYIELMKKNGWERKIPQRVYDRMQLE